MSIISDALNKTGGNPEEEPDRNVTEGPYRRGVNWSFLMVIAVVIFVAAPITVPAVMKMVQKRAPLERGMLTLGSEGEDTARPLMAEAQFSVEERPIFTFTDGPVFKLEGIVLSQEGHYAILNGAVITQGEMIDGAQLVSIAENRVELDYQGRKIILRSQ